MLFQNESATEVDIPLPTTAGLWAPVDKSKAKAAKPPADADKSQTLGQDGEAPPSDAVAPSPKLQTPAMMRRISGHRRSPSAPASLPSAKQILGGAATPKTPSGSTTRSSSIVEEDTLVIELTRMDGGFGLTLNDFNRVTAIAPQSAAVFGGVKLFDRVTHVDGLALTGKMSAAVAGRGKVELTVERPPMGLYRAIATKENSPTATSPLALRTPGLGAMLGPLRSSPLKEEHPVDSQSPALVRAIEALAEAATADSPDTVNPAAIGLPPAPPFAATTTTPTASSGVAPAASHRAGWHRRNMSEPASSFSSPLSAAAVHSINSHPFWTEFDASSLSSAKATATTTTPAAPAAAAPNDSADGSPTSPRSVTASPTPTRGGSAKDGSKSGGGLRATASRWWERRTSKDAKSEREALKADSRREKELQRELSKLKEPPIPTAVPVMDFDFDKDLDLSEPLAAGYESC